MMKDLERGDPNLSEGTILTFA